jgi:ATP-dependent Clp protease adapter protein ClpS
MVLHCVALEDNKMFLLESNSTTWPEILKECLLDPFCQEYAPQKVVFSTLLNDDETLEDVVGLFQELFGEDDTRAGTTICTSHPECSG